MALVGLNRSALQRHRLPRSVKLRRLPIRRLASQRLVSPPAGLYDVYLNLINLFYFYKLNGSVKEPNMFHNYATEKIARKASDAAEYIMLFGSSTRDRHARRI